MLIILEGPDCAGKSTLAQQIVARLAVKYPNDTIELLHRGPPTQHPLDEYVAPLLDYKPNEGRHIICDRWHWGEVVYPPVLGRRTLMDDAVFNYTELFIRSRGGVTFFVTKPLETLRRRFEIRGDNVVALDQLPTVAYRFMDLYSRSLTGHHMEMMTPDKITWIAHGAEVNHVVTDFVTPVGDIVAPATLVLGDVRGCGGLGCQHTTAHGPSGTAFMPYRGTSGHFLFTALHSPHFGLTLSRSWAYANACDVDDVEKMWWQMHRPPVITLGVNASKRLTEAKIDHAAVPHPQFIRRFHHAAAAEYGQLIRTVARTERNELKWRPTPL